MERKYKIICEALDYGDNKKALQECERTLRKFEAKKQDKIDVKFIRALKCLTFCRQGRKSDAVEALQVLLDEKISDPEVLQVMQTVCKELRSYDSLLTMFENAAKINPSEENLSQLFTACVINNEYKRQHQVAMKLHQACPDKNHYYFWSVVSIIMQAIAEPKLARTIYLPLAEKLCKKSIQENKMTAETEMILYMDVLKRQENYDAAITFLVDSPLVRRHMDEIDYRQTRLAEFYYLKKKWSECFDAYQRLLVNHPEQWLFWERLAESGLTLASQGDNSKIPAILTSIKEAQESKREQQPRAALLAPIHLLAMAKERNIVADPIASLSMKDQFKAYLKLYSNRPCAIDDLQAYVKQLKPEELKEICDDIVHNHVFFKDAVANGNSTNSDSAESSKKGSRMIDELDQIVTAEALLMQQNIQATGVQADIFAQRVERLKRVISKYESICSVNGGSAVNDSDNRPGDRVIVLAASNLLELYHRTSKISYLYEAGNLLMDLPENNYSKQLLHLVIYNILGAGVHAFYVFTKLDIKHVQFETLGYLALSTLSQSGSLTHYSAVLDGCLRQATLSSVDFSHSLPLAYQCGTFTKIPEMVELQQRLKSSTEYYQYTLEKMLFDLIMTLPECAAAVASEIAENLSRDRIPWNDLQLIRDYYPFATCFLSVPSTDDCDKFLALQKVILRFSLTEAKLLSTCVTRPNMEDVNTLGSELINLGNDIVVESNKLAASVSSWPAFPIFHCWPMNDLSVLPARCVLLTSVARLGARVVSALANYENSERDPFDDPMVAERDLIHDVQIQLKELVAKLKPEACVADNQAATFTLLYGITRTLCEVSVCLIVPVERMRFVKAHQMKLAKKKKDITVNSSFFEVHNDFLAKSFQESVATVVKFCGELRDKLDPIAAESAKTFKGRVYESYCVQLQQLNERLGRLSSFSFSVK